MHRVQYSRTVIQRRRSQRRWNQSGMQFEGQNQLVVGNQHVMQNALTNASNSWVAHLPQQITNDPSINRFFNGSQFV